MVSTYQAGQIVTIRSQNTDLNTHFASLERPMGMTLHDGELAVGSAYQLLQYRNIPAVAPKVEPSGTHDACYILRNTRVTGDIDIHEMAYGNDGLWIVNTRMSCLCTLDQKYSVVPRWRPPFIKAYDLGDRCHLNGLAMQDGEPAFVTALGETDTPGGWRKNKASGGLLMEVSSGQVLRRGISMPHSPRWYQNKLWFLESGKGELCYLDSATGEKTVVAMLPGFTRGLDFIGQYAFVGLSQVRETAIFAGLPLTQRVEDRKCGVWIVDINLGEVVGFLSFTGNVKEIFSVQIVPSAFPALLDVDDPLVRTSYTLPDAALKDVAPDDPLQTIRDQALQAYAKQDYQSAISLYGEVIEHAPEDIAARYSLGLLYYECERWQDALNALETLVDKDPDHAEAYNTLGSIHVELKDYQSAMNYLERAISIDQKFAQAHFNRGLLNLKLGQFKEGWKGFEWRWQLPDFTPLGTHKPKWDGGDISDQTLLVHTEQGNGDAIQYARFLPLAKTKCAKLVVLCVEALRDLFQTMDCVDEVRVPGNLSSDTFDTFIPIMSLTKIFSVDHSDVATTYPYLAVPDYVSVPALANNQKQKIGICWKGQASHSNDKNRSIALDLFLSMFSSDVDLISFQLPVNPDERKLLSQSGIKDLEPHLTDYARTAAFLTQIDLLVTVDTSVAHLAGALNIPTWIILPHNSDWRWQLTGDTTPWYDSVRLFRQDSSANKDKVLDKVKHALQSEL